MFPVQLLIIGGGASGLAAAATAFSMGIKQIAILERLPRVGKKILATGNGRCNLSHDSVSVQNYQGSYDPTEILMQFGSAENFFSALGLYCRTDQEGRIYPYSLSASAVLDALRLACENVQLFCNTSVKDLFFHSGKWHALTESGQEFSADSVIFSAGGIVQPKFGTDGSAWKILERLQIPIVQGKPILCPLLSEKKLLQPLKGLRVKASVTLCRQKNYLSTEIGEIQFTEKAISGICIFNLSSCFIHQPTEYFLSVNFFPELDVPEIISRLYACQAVRCSSSCVDMLSGLLLKPLAGVILKQANISVSMPCSELSALQIRKIALLCHEFHFPILGTVKEQAQATAGGVHGSALDQHLQVKQFPRLCITGEAVDIHAPCGGYQLHWAWASGYSAGKFLSER